MEENQRANEPGQEWDVDDSFDRDHKNSLYLKVVEDAIQHAVFRRVKRACERVGDENGGFRTARVARGVFERR